LNENIKQMKNVVSRMPKSINESIYFEDDDMMDGNEELITDDEEETFTDNDEKISNNNASEKARKLIDDIRKMSLRAMAELADTPDDENYIMLKKVWSMTDRKPEQQNGMNNSNNRPINQNM